MLCERRTSGRITDTELYPHTLSKFNELGNNISSVLPTVPAQMLNVHDDNHLHHKPALSDWMVVQLCFTTFLHFTLLGISYCFE